jgi:hypothetical protein
MDLMTGKRKHYSTDFKAKIAVEALRAELFGESLQSMSVERRSEGEITRSAVMWISLPSRCLLSTAGQVDETGLTPIGPWQYPPGNTPLAIPRI